MKKLIEPLTAILTTFAHRKPLSQSELLVLLKAYDIETTERRVREAIHQIRRSGALPGLVSTGGGYLMASKPNDILNAVKRLDRQIHEMRTTRNALNMHLESTTGLCVVNQDDNYHLLHLDDIEPPEYEGVEVFENHREMLAWEGRDKC